MGSPLPPDPYVALGLAKDATAVEIKKKYRNLALKFHPDKVQDEGAKHAAADQFHKIQTAYEIVGDEERRQRYDAQCKLAELRRDVMERGVRGGVDIRTASYKVPTESARGGEYYTRGPERSSRVSPTYEERIPSYAQSPPPTSYFDPQPRSMSRKNEEYERSSKHASTRGEKEKTRSARGSKENERSSRKEKSRRTERDVRKDRDRKMAYVSIEEDEDSDSDQHERARRKMQMEDEQRRAREAFYEEGRRFKEDAANGYYGEDIARKVFTQHDAAKDYIERSIRTTRQQPESAPVEPRRPSPNRAQSSKDKVESVKHEGKPIMFRRGSGRPKTLGRDAQTKKSSSRDKERKPSLEIVDEPRETRKMPTLNQTKSSPADIRPVEVRPTSERQRAQSVQVEEEDVPPLPPPPKPQMRRAETMPYKSSSRDSRRAKEFSKARHYETTDGYITPEATPEPQSARKYHYGQEYADDDEYPTPDGYRTTDGYRTEVREPQPTRPRYTRSPSPVKDRERPRHPSSKYSSSQSQARPQPTRTTSTTYQYGPGGQSESYSRPAVSREDSGRSGHLYYGEVPTTTRSPKQSQSRYSPPADSVYYQREIRPEDIKVQTGYKRRPSHMNEPPRYSRSGSGSQPVDVR